MNLYTPLRRIWQSLPEGMKQQITSSQSLNSIRTNVSDLFKQHDDIYDETFYEEWNEPRIRQEYSAMAEEIIEFFKPSSALDVGCGSGNLMSELKSRGVTIQGLEYSTVGVKICRERGLGVQQFNLEKDRLDSASTFDVVISTEVAEHLPASCADRYVDLLCQSSTRIIVFTAATPGQGGKDHVNEQPHEYWIEKFTQRGFAFDESTSLACRESWKARQVINDFYWQNLMIFNR
jgi:cyclopropane fatty-acyl-phospholipid synthase-like methyltransferase